MLRSSDGREMVTCETCNRIIYKDGAHEYDGKFYDDEHAPSGSETVEVPEEKKPEAPETPPEEPTSGAEAESDVGDEKDDWDALALSPRLTELLRENYDNPYNLKDLISRGEADMTSVEGIGESSAEKVWKALGVTPPGYAE